MALLSRPAGRNASAARALTGSHRLGSRTWSAPRRWLPRSSALRTWEGSAKSGVQPVGAGPSRRETRARTCRRPTVPGCRRRCRSWRGWTARSARAAGTVRSVDDQDGMAMAATGQAQCLGQVATERVDRDVVEAGQARGQVLVGRPLDKPCAGLGGNRVAVEGVVDGAAQPRVGERSARGVEDEVVHLIVDGCSKKCGRAAPPAARSASVGGPLRSPTSRSASARGRRSSPRCRRSRARSRSRAAHRR